MQMTLLSITVWFTHFLIAFNFNTLPAHTLSDYTETTQITPTTTTTNQQPKTLIKAKPSSPLTTITQQNTTNPTTEVHIQPNTAPSLETTSLHQYNSTPPQNEMMDEDVSISSARDAAMRHTITLTTVSTNSPKLTSQKDENSETTSNASYNNEPNVTSTLEMTSMHQYNSSPSKNNTDDEDVSISDAGDVPMNYTNTTPTVFTNFTRLKSTLYNGNETRRMSNRSYNDDGDTTEPNTTLNLTSMHQYNSSLSQNHMMDEDSNASDAALNYTNTTPTVFTNSPRLTSQYDENNETWTTSNVRYNNERNTAEPNTTQNMASMLKMRSLHQYNSSLSQNGTNDEEVSISNAGGVAVNYTNITPTVFTNFTRLMPRKDENNQTGISYNHLQTVDPFSNVSTDPWKEKEDETTKADEGNYETNSTQATFVNVSEQWRETPGTEGSYGFTSEHREEDYNTTANTINARAATDWSTSQNTDILMTTPAYTITQDPAVTDESEYHTSAGGVDNSTKPQDLFTSTHTESENMTGTGPPIGFTTINNNNSIITDVLTDNSTYPSTNITDTESKVWPTCFNSSRQSTMVCFITVWALAMTAAIFLGVTIFLWVRLSIVKERMKMKEKRVEVGEKQSLWADPKASVQERVEFWYVNGSTLEADRKDKDRKRQERMKRRGQEQVNEENELWMQPRVTVDDITEFWYANRRMREERMRDMGL